MSDLFSLAIIPARGGSKRIPRKNIKLFNGKPIVSYSVAAAQEAKCFSDVIVSTEDEEIANVVRGFGGKVPFMRSATTADDYAGIADVLKEAVVAYEVWSGHVVDLIFCALATAPFVTADNIRKGYQQITKNGTDAVLTVVRYDYPIQRAFRVEGQHVSMIWPENYIKRSQELEPSYHDAGQFYWIKKDKLFEHGKMFIPQTGFICINSMQAQDIDTEEDWMIAEEKYKMLQLKKNI